VLGVLYHHAKFGGAPISPAAGVAKNVEFFVSVCLLFVCLFVTLLIVRDCAPDFAMKALEHRTIRVLFRPYFGGEIPPGKM